jgi:hypothetical protein
MAEGGLLPPHQVIKEKPRGPLRELGDHPAGCQSIAQAREQGERRRLC